MTSRPKPGGGLTIPSVRSTSVVTAATLVLGGVTGVVLARVLGPGQRGEVVIATIGPLLIGAVGTLGIEEAVVFVVARRNRGEDVRDMVWNGIVVATALGIAGAVISLCLQRWYVGTRTPDIDKVTLYSYALIPVMISITACICGCLRGLHRYLVWNAARLFIPFAYFLAVVAAISTHRLTPALAVWAHWIPNLLVTLFLVGTAFREWRRPTFSRHQARQLVRLGTGNHLVTVQRMGNQQLDQFLMAHYVSPSALGTYAVAATYASAGLGIGLSIGWQFYSHASSIGSVRASDFRRLTLRMNFSMGAVAVLGAASAWIAVPLLLGPQFRGAIVPAALLMLGVPFLALGTLYASAWKASAQPLRAAFAECVGLITTIVLLVVLLPRLGIIGAAITSIVAYAIVAIWLVAGPRPTVVNKPSAADFSAQPSPSPGPT